MPLDRVPRQPFDALVDHVDGREGRLSLGRRKSFPIIPHVNPQQCLLGGVLQRCLAIIASFLLLSASNAFGHSELTHQYIAFEAANVWRDLPQEVRDHIQGHLIGAFEPWGRICHLAGECANFDPGDEIVVGSAEEDGWVILDRNHGLSRPAFIEHFWNPDSLSAGEFDVGITAHIPALDFSGQCLTYGSAFKRAEQLYERAKSLYRAGDKDQAYYELGRVAHLLTDMTVPAHVHNDAHPGLKHGLDSLLVGNCGEGGIVGEVGNGDDAYEDFMGTDANISRFIRGRGSRLARREYRLEALPNIPSDFDWDAILPGASPLFKLFWYTAQKTQYFASDGNLNAPELGHGDNGLFTRRDGSQKLFSPNLWQNELAPTAIVHDPRQIESTLGIDNPQTLSRVAAALIPHALKAVAGLYRLFSLEVVMVKLTVTNEETGTGTIIRRPIGIPCGTDTYCYLPGTAVTLQARAGKGSVFLGWNGGGCSGTGVCSVVLDNDTSLVANFHLLQRVSLAVVREGTGNGTVTSRPAGINCGAACSEDYLERTVVTLTARASSGSTFTGWRGGGCSGTGPCRVTIGGPINVFATFGEPVTLTVVKEGTGSGTVTSMPTGISCGNDCTQSYPEGAMVTLRATAASGSLFVGWRGGGCAGTDPCMITLYEGIIVTATFSRPRMIGGIIIESEELVIVPPALTPEHCVLRVRFRNPTNVLKSVNLIYNFFDAAERGIAFTLISFLFPPQSSITREGLIVDPAGRLVRCSEIARWELGTWVVYP